MRNYLIFNGRDSRDFGVYISGSGVYNAPERTYDFIEVPGRNGDLLGHQKRLKNTELTYPAFICRDFKRNHQAFRSFLLSQIGYCRLSDSYYPDEYRMAVYFEAMEVEPTERNDAGSFDLTFYCKPQRYLTSGETVHTFTESGSTITNPTAFPSSPLLRVYGTGAVGIGSYSFNILSADGYTDIDSEIMDCYKGAEARNENVQFTNYEFPLIDPGEHGIVFDPTITRVDITPRWWNV